MSPEHFPGAREGRRRHWPPRRPAYVDAVRSPVRSLDHAVREDDDCESRSSAGSKSASTLTTKGGISSRFPLQANGNKRRKHLPVRSSGYGRANPSSNNAGSSSSSSRSSTPIIERCPGPPNSPANSISSISSARSTSRLRHGDGTLPGSTVARESSGANANGFFRKNSLLRGGLRSRSPSPVPRPDGRAGTGSGLRTPSPICRIRQERGGDDDDVGSALRRLRGIERQQKLLRGSATKIKRRPFPFDCSRKDALDVDLGRRHDQQRQQQQNENQNMKSP